MGRIFRTFLAGVLALLPIAVTVFVVAWIASFIASYAGPDSFVGRLIIRLGASVGIDVTPGSIAAYLLGLAMVAFTKPAVGFLRQGCNLVLDGDKKPESSVVFADGRREVLGLAHDAALAFAKRTAAAFGVGESRRVKFDTKLAMDEVAGEGKKKTSKKAKVE